MAETIQDQIDAALCSSQTGTNEILRILLQIAGSKVSNNESSVLRNMAVTSTFAALPNVPGKLVSIKNRTGGNLSIRKINDSASANNNVIPDGDEVAYFVSANSNELEVSSSADGRIEIVID